MTTSVEALYGYFSQCTGISLDSRTVEVGQMFFGIKGENFDGNTFVKQALSKGARYAVTSDPTQAELYDHVFFVKDTLVTLQALAKIHRSTLALPVIAVGGSNGKTTTKELLKHIFFLHFNIYATPGNFNNQIGLPLCVLSLKPEHQLAVLEIGDNAPGEVARLCEIAQPTAGVITNVGEDHLQFFENLEHNAKTKLELFDYLIANSGLLFFNSSDPLIKKFKVPSNSRVCYYGRGGHYTETLITNALSELTLEINTPEGQKIKVTSQLCGRYNAENILSAVAITHYFGVPVDKIVTGIASYKPTNYRSQLIQSPTLNVVFDAYNANPSSVEAAIRNIFSTDDAGLVGLILGDMLELGNKSVPLHRRIGYLIDAYKPVLAVLVGPEMAIANTVIIRCPAYHFNTVDEAVLALPNLLKKHPVNTLLVKGSRGIALEKVVPVILPEVQLES